MKFFLIDLFNFFYQVLLQDKQSCEINDVTKAETIFVFNLVQIYGVLLSV